MSKFQKKDFKIRFRSDAGKASPELARSDVILTWSEADETSNVQEWRRSLLTKTNDHADLKIFADVVEFERNKEFYRNFDAEGDVRKMNKKKVRLIRQIAEHKVMMATLAAAGASAGTGSSSGASAGAGSSSGASAGAGSGSGTNTSSSSGSASSQAAKKAADDGKTGGIETRSKKSAGAGSGPSKDKDDDLSEDEKADEKADEKKAGEDKSQKAATTPPVQPPTPLDILEDLEADLLCLDGEIEDLRSRVKDDVRRVDKDQDDYIKLSPACVEFFLSTVSVTSRQRVQMHMDYKKAYEDKDPLEIFKIILKSHTMGSITMSSDELERTVNMKFLKMRMYETETVSQFKQRIVDMMTEAKRSNVIITEGAAILQFREGLHRARFSELQTEVSNELKKPRSPGQELPLHLQKLDALATWAMSYKVQRMEGNFRPQQAAFPIKAGNTTRYGQRSNDNADKHSSKAGATEGASDTPKGGAKKVRFSNNDTTKIICYHCNLPGHVRSHCPERKKEGARMFCIASAKQELLESVNGPEREYEFKHGEWDRRELVTSKLFALSGEDIPKDAVLPDNQCSQHIFGNAELLSDIRAAPVPVVFSGLGGNVTASQVGEFKPLGVTVYYSKKCPVNALSWAQISKDMQRFETGFIQPGSFWIKPLHTGEIHNYEVVKENMYVKRYQQEHLHVTIAEKESRYPVRDVARARAAKDFQDRVGVPVPAGALELMLQTANNSTNIAPRDIRLANEIFGTPVSELLGKSTEPENIAVDLQVIRKPMEKVVDYYSDLFLILNEWYLLSVISITGIIVANWLGKTKSVTGTRTASNVKEALLLQAAVATKEGFQVKNIFFDGESAVGKLVRDGVLSMEKFRLVLSPTGKVGQAENAGKLVKSWVRGLYHSIMLREGWKIPKFLGKDLVTFVVNRINCFASKRGLPGVPAIEALTGIRVDATRDFRASFGDYAQVTTPALTNKNSTDIARTEAAIFLHNAGNKGAGKFFTLFTMRRVTRTKFSVLAKPVEIIEKLRSMTVGEDFVEEAEDPVEVDLEELTQDATDMYGRGAHDDGATLSDVVEELIPSDEASRDTGQSDEAEVGVIPEDDPGILEVLSEDDPGEEVANEELIPAIDEATEGNMPEEHEWIPMPEKRYSTRGNVVDYASLSGRKNKVFIAYGYNISVKRAIQEDYDKATASIAEEILQIVDKGTLRFTRWEDLSKKRRDKVLRSFLFLKQKYDLQGNKTKLKSRLVANGKEQKREDFKPNEIASPTVGLTSLLILAAIAAMQRYYCRVYDIPGAYLNAEMPEGHEVDVLLDKTVSAVLCNLKPELRKYQRWDGCIVGRLCRAMYGTIQAAKLWYDDISNLLINNGFVVNKYDPCVFSKVSGTNRIDVCLYVDDLFVSASNENLLNELEDLLKGRYGGVTTKSGNKLEYLGMVFDFSVAGELSITMTEYEKDCIREIGSSGVATTPAEDDLFTTKNPDAILDRERKSKLHSMTAKLLFLSKRTRPEIMLAVGYLTTTVNNPTEEDWDKLQRISRYLNGSLGMGIKFTFGERDILMLLAAIDAAYGCHLDGKSHSGVVITVGGGPVMVASSKQKIVSKSSHEAELIALSDGGSHVLWSREFIISLGYDLPAAVIHQDNQATIRSITNGRPGDRSKHVKIRHFWLKEQIDNGEVLIKYLPTEDMPADVLTKPLQGKQFEHLRNLLLNWK